MNTSNASMEDVARATTRKAAASIIKCRAEMAASHGWDIEVGMVDGWHGFRRSNRDSVVWITGEYDAAKDEFRFAWSFDSDRAEIHTGSASAMWKAVVDRARKSTQQ